jgi:imidazolonepropionase
MGLKPAEAVWAATRGGALALEETRKGWIVPGAVADLVVLDAPSYVHIPYRPGTNLAWAVIKDGAVVS